MEGFEKKSDGPKETNEFVSDDLDKQLVPEAGQPKTTKQTGSVFSLVKDLWSWLWDDDDTNKGQKIIQDIGQIDAERNSKKLKIAKKQQRQEAKARAKAQAKAKQIQAKLLQVRHAEEKKQQALEKKKAKELLRQSKNNQTDTHPNKLNELDRELSMQKLAGDKFDQTQVSTPGLLDHRDLVDQGHSAVRAGILKKRQEKEEDLNIFGSKTAKKQSWLARLFGSRPAKTKSPDQWSGLKLSDNKFKPESVTKPEPTISSQASSANLASEPKPAEPGLIEADHEETQAKMSAPKLVVVGQNEEEVRLTKAEIKQKKLATKKALQEAKLAQKEQAKQAKEQAKKQEKEAKNGSIISPENLNKGLAAVPVGSIKADAVTAVTEESSEEPKIDSDKPVAKDDFVKHKKKMAKRLSAEREKYANSKIRDDIENRYWHSHDIVRANLIKEQESLFFNWNSKILTLVLGLGLAGLTVGVLYGGLLVWEANKLKQNSYIFENLDSINLEINKEEAIANEILDFNDKLVLVDFVLDNHIYWTNFFKFLEEYTIMDVYYEGFSGDIGGEYALPTVAKDFRSIYLQIKLMQKYDKVMSANTESAKQQTQPTSYQELEAKQANPSPEIPVEGATIDRIKFMLDLVVDRRIFLK